MQVFYMTVNLLHNVRYFVVLLQLEECILLHRQAVNVCLE